MVPVVLIIGLIVAAWVACFLACNDLLLKNVSLTPYRSVLFIFAHMDDETVLAGGMLAQTSKQSTLMILTKGERGNDTRTVDPLLPAIRRAELSRVQSILGFKKLIHLDYADETLCSKKQQVKKDIEKIIKKTDPDLIVTFDLHGWYGHPDHIACAEAVTEIVKTSYPEKMLWYAVRPEAMNLAARVVAARRGATLSPRTPPKRKVYIGLDVVKKIRAIYQYQSQMSALRPGVTLGPLPMWFCMSAQPLEYVK